MRKLPLLLGWSVLLFTVACTRTPEERVVTFHESLSDDARTLDPAQAYDPYSLPPVASIYETLYQYAYLSEKPEIVPLLAEDLPRISPDGRTVTVSIRAGIRFQDEPCFRKTGGKGREVTAHDFVYAIKRLALPSLQSPGWWILDQKIAGLNAFHDRLVAAAPADVPRVFGEAFEGLTALDAHTLQFKLTRPYPQLLYVLTLPFTAPVPEEAITAYGTPEGANTDHPVGSGPFVLSKWERQKRLVLDRNPNYHADFYPAQASPLFRKQGFLSDFGKPMPFVDRIEWTISPDPEQTWDRFLTGHLDVVSIPRQQIPKVVLQKQTLSPRFSAKGFRLSVEEGSSLYFLVFNLKDPVLGKNTWLRQAISAAIDRQKWMELIANGMGQKLDAVIPSSFPDAPRNPNLKFDYNLRLARKLLDEAGHPNGRGLPEFSLEMRNDDAANRRIGQFLQQQLADIGIHLKLNYNSLAGYLLKVRQGRFQIGYGAWGVDYPDPENILQLLYGPNANPGPNEGSYNSPEFNRLYDRMRVLRAGPERQAIIRKINDLVQTDCPWVLGYTLNKYLLAQPWLANYRANDFILNKYKYLKLNAETKRRYQEE